MTESNKNTSTGISSNNTMYIVIGICIFLVIGGGYWWWSRDKKGSNSSSKKGSPNSSKTKPSNNPSTLIQTYFRSNAYDSNGKTGKEVRDFLQNGFKSPPYKYRFLSPKSTVTKEYDPFRINIVTSNGKSTGTTKNVYTG